ncbi:Putative vgr related protein [Minicystis rosea]|nr:Putative vgr related protein [Minicystis rosea]
MARDFEAHLTIGKTHASRVSAFDAIHEAGRPFVVEIDAVFSSYIELEALLGKPAKLAYGVPGDEPRCLFGIVESATAVGLADARLDGGTHYTLRVVSMLALLERSVDSRIYQDMTVREIITDVLERHGIKKVVWRLKAKYPKREYCVQYQESALAFVMRLCEHEGIYSFVEPSAEEEILVFDDDSTAALPMSGDPELPLRRRTALADAGDAAYALRQKEQVRSGKFVLRDFDFKRPQLDLTAEKQSAERTGLEVYDYPGGYFEPTEGKRLSEVRLEAEQVLRRTVEIDASCTRIAVGQKLEITDAGDAGGKLFVFAAHHRYVHQSARERGGGKGAAMNGSGSSYVVRARLVPLTVKYRLARVTPIPVIEGPQTATVVVPAGSPGETIHTDEHGRCKVKFRWDRSPPTDDRASCWMRVAQLQTSGSMMLPRIGWEVIVEFLEGNPDRPIVTGRLYNGSVMPPYALPEGKTRTSIKSQSTPGGGGNNEIRFEDKAGSEEIMLNAQHDMKVVAANNAKTSVGNNETRVVGNNHSLTVGANQTTKITKGSSNTIGANQTVKVGGNRKVEVNAVTGLNVAGNSTTKVAGSQFEMDGNPLEALLQIAAQAAEQFVASLADNAIANVQAHVDGALNQVMGPINQLNQQVQGIQNAMQAVKNGDLSGVGSMVAGASGLPGASEMVASMGGRGGGGGGGASADGGGAAEGGGGGGSPTNALAGMAQGAAHNAIHQGVGAAHNALANALGLDSGGGSGESGANAAGPAGNVGGIDATDREKGPGHSTAVIAGSHTEKVGSIKALGAIKQIDTNVTANKTIDVGAATVQLAIGNYGESARGNKTESALGLVVLSKAGESEEVGGSKTTMVGGAIVDKLKGSHAIQAGGPATFIGAFHKMEAKQSITFKCGASTVVIDEAGITIKSPIVAVLAPKIQLPQKVSEV